MKAGSGYTVDTQCVSMAKDAGFRIRVDDSLRAEFIAACKRQDRTAAQVLRDFMRRFVEDTPRAAQKDLFGEQDTAMRVMESQEQ
jgi:hypothetical protein